MTVIYFVLVVLVTLAIAGVIERRRILRNKRRDYDLVRLGRAQHDIWRKGAIRIKQDGKIISKSLRK